MVTLNNAAKEKGTKIVVKNVSNRTSTILSYGWSESERGSWTKITPHILKGLLYVLIVDY